MTGSHRESLAGAEVHDVDCGALLRAKWLGPERYCAELSQRGSSIRIRGAEYSDPLSLDANLALHECAELDAP